MKHFKISKSTRNIPLIELHNECMLNDCEIDVNEEEMILFEVKLQ
jgi:hypothetical protein